MPNSKKTYPVIFVLFLFFTQINAQEYKVESFNFGSSSVSLKVDKKKKKSTLYWYRATLNGRSSSALEEETALQWSKAHPNATAVQITSQPLRYNEAIIRVSYVWVRDGKDNLNIRLVRSGACEAKIMLVNPEDEKNILVGRQEYLEFKRLILEAESKAGKEHIGIWQIKKNKP